MTTGGGPRDILAGLRHGVRRLWVGFHDDQRLSWLGHYLICESGSCGLAFVVAVFLPERMLWFAVIKWCLATGLLAFFLLRETGDEHYHRDVKKDWDKLDADRNLRGAPRRGVTPRFDKDADLTGPAFCWGTSTTCAVAAVVFL